MTGAEFQAAGLYDPQAPNAADRLALLEWLAGRGITLEQMVAAHRRGLLTSLAGDVALRPERRWTLAEIADRVGMPPRRVEEMILAAGLLPPAPDEPFFNDQDVATFGAFSLGAAQLGDEAVLRFVRVMGSSLARIAEAVLALFYVHVEVPIRARHAAELTLAQAILRAIETVHVVPEAMARFFAAHMETAITRFRQARRSPSAETAHFTSGFVDLVGYSRLSRRMTASELGAVIDRFEDTAHALATVRGGRVVKLVGDEVMFVTPTAAAGCDIALALVEQFADDPSITPRGGLASGDVLPRGGDYYGPTVNLAARLAEIAVPSELLVTPEVAAEAKSANLHFAPAGKRLLKGFEEPVTLLTVERVSDRSG